MTLTVTIISIFFNSFVNCEIFFKQLSQFSTFISRHSENVQPPQQHTTWLKNENLRKKSHVPHLRNGFFTLDLYLEVEHTTKPPTLFLYFHVVKHEHTGKYPHCVMHYLHFLELTIHKTFDINLNFHSPLDHDKSHHRLLS